MSNHDYTVLVFLWLSVLLQAVPSYYAIRIIKLTGYIRYWTLSWVIFIAVMVWIMARRLTDCLLFEYCPIDSGLWLFDNVISTIGSSIGFTLICSLQYRFYNYWMSIAPMLKKQAREQRERNQKSG